MILEFSRQIFEKKTQNTKFHQNPSSGSRVVPRGMTNGRADMKKLIEAFRNFANGPKNSSTTKTAHISKICYIISKITYHKSRLAVTVGRRLYAPQC